MAYEEYGNEEAGEGEQQKKRMKALEERVQRMRVEEQKRELAKRFLDGGAWDRLMNIRLSNPDLYAQLVDLVLSLVQSKRLQGRLTEQQLIKILEQANARPEPKIEFKRK